MIRRHTPVFIALAVVLVTAGILYFAISRSQQPDEPELTPPQIAEGKARPENEPSKDPKAKAAGITIEGADIERRDPQGQLEWKVTVGGDLEFDEGRQVVTGSNVKFEMLQGGRLPVIVNAPVFEGDYAAKRLTFRQGVKGHMKDGSAHFTVSHLTYDFDTRKLIGSGGAQYVAGQNKATAREIVMDAVAKKVRMRGGVRFEHRG